MTASTEDDLLARLNVLLIQTLTRLARGGDAEGACRLAADAYALLRCRRPQEAVQLNAALHRLVRLLPRPERNNLEVLTMSEITALDVRELPPARRHALIFDTYAALPADGAFILINDHDPKPLYYQFQAERPGEVSWEYLDQGPEVWRVRIGRKARVAV
ncbi:MAG TPA: DUF2249 domain-containing protein [Stellaceae bacterium]|nr:DUF2249 domain-containing protein [Stellaceae bacterium]